MVPNYAGRSDIGHRDRLFKIGAKFFCHVVRESKMFNGLELITRGKITGRVTLGSAVKFCGSFLYTTQAERRDRPLSWGLPSRPIKGLLVSAVPGRRREHVTWPNLGVTAPAGQRNENPTTPAMLWRSCSCYTPATSTSDSTSMASSSACPVMSPA